MPERKEFKMAIFYNQATLSYNGGIVNSNITTGEILEALSVTKTAVADSYSPNSEITYIVNIVNSGNTSFTGLSISDDLGAYDFGGATVQPLDYVNGSVTYFVNGVLQADPTVTVGDDLVISGINVPANSVATVAYTAKANAFASPEADGVINNAATVSGAGITPITAEESVSAVAAPLLAISKSLTPTTVTENGQITYTFVISNNGNEPAVANDNIVVSDTFDPILSNISVSYNGVAWSSPENYNYDEATGAFSTLPGEITVPAASYVRDAVTGEWVVIPGTVTLTVSGTV